MKKIFKKNILNKIYFLFVISLLSFDSFGQVRIYEIYGGGGNAGATYQDDFIVLYNDGPTPVNLNGWSIQYAPPGSTTASWSKLDIASISIAAKGFIFISITTNGTNGVNFPINSTTFNTDLVWPAISGGSGLNQSDGKIALMSNQTLINTQTPPALGLVDFVGYGNAANASEGSPAPSPTATTNGIVRKSVSSTQLGQDTNNNSADFVLTNSSAPSILRLSSSTSFPVKLTQLSANIFEEKQAIINWQTSSEVGFSHFEVQRSGDAKGFETIGRAESKGQNTERNEYAFIDNSPIVGQNYYRLKAVDLDGTEEYSKILSLNFNEPSGLVFYPNPALNALEMRGLESKNIAKVNVYNNVGLLIGSPKVIDNKIDVSTFAAQLLWVEAILTDKTIYRKKIVKF
jgi:Lamin Tail Domain